MGVWFDYEDIEEPTGDENLLPEAAPAIRYTIGQTKFPTVYPAWQAPFVKDVDTALDIAEELKSKGADLYLARFLSVNPHIAPYYFELHKEDKELLKPKKEEKEGRDENVWDWFWKSALGSIFGRSEEEVRRRNKLIEDIQSNIGKEPKRLIKPEDVFGRILTKDLLIDGINSGALVLRGEYIYATAGEGDKPNIPIGRIGSDGRIKTLWYTADSPTLDILSGQMPFIKDPALKKLSGYLTPATFGFNLVRQLTEAAGSLLPKEGIIGEAVKGYTKGLYGDIDKFIGQLPALITGEKNIEYGGAEHYNITSPDLTEAEITTRMLSEMAGSLTKALLAAMGVGILGGSAALAGAAGGATTTPMHLTGLMTGEETGTSALAKSLADISLGVAGGKIIPSELSRMGGQIATTGRYFKPFAEHIIRSPIRQAPAIAGSTGLYLASEYGKERQTPTIQDFTKQFAEQAALAVAIDIGMNLSPIGYAGTVSQYKKLIKNTNNILNTVSDEINSIIKAKGLDNTAALTLERDDINNIINKLSSKGLIKEIKTIDDYNAVNALIENIHKSIISSPERPYKISFKEEGNTIVPKIEWVVEGATAKKGGDVSEVTHTKPEVVEAPAVKGGGEVEATAKPELPPVKDVAVTPTEYHPKPPAEYENIVKPVDIAMESLNAAKEAKEQKKTLIKAGFDELYRRPQINKIGKEATFVIDYQGGLKDGKYYNEGANNLIRFYELATGESIVNKTPQQIVETVKKIFNLERRPVNLEPKKVLSVEDLKYKTKPYQELTPVERALLRVEVADYVNSLLSKSGKTINELPKEIIAELGISEKTKPENVFVRIIDEIIKSNNAEANELISTLNKSFELKEEGAVGGVTHSNILQTEKVNIKEPLLPTSKKAPPTVDLTQKAAQISPIEPTITEKGGKVQTELSKKEVSSINSIINDLASKYRKLQKSEDKPKVKYNYLKQALNKLEKQHTDQYNILKSIAESKQIKEPKLQELGYIIKKLDNPKAIDYAINKYTRGLKTISRATSIAPVKEQALKIAKKKWGDNLTPRANEYKPPETSIPVNKFRQYKEKVKNQEIYKYDDALKFAEDLQVPQGVKTAIEYLKSNHKINIIYDNTGQPIQTAWAFDKLTHIDVKSTGLPPEINIYISRQEDINAPLAYNILLGVTKSEGKISSAVKQIIEKQAKKAKNILKSEEPDKEDLTLNMLSAIFRSHLYKSGASDENYAPVLEKYTISALRNYFHSYADINSPRDIANLFLEHPIALAMYRLNNKHKFLTNEELAQNKVLAKVKRMNDSLVNNSINIIKETLPSQFKKAMGKELDDFISLALVHDNIALNTDKVIDPNAPVVLPDGSMIKYENILKPETLENRLLFESAYLMHAPLSIQKSIAPIDYRKMKDMGIINPDYIVNKKEGNKTYTVYGYKNAKKFFDEIGLTKLIGKPITEILEKNAIELSINIDKQSTAGTYYSSSSKAFGLAYARGIAGQGGIDKIALFNNDISLTAMIHEIIHGQLARYSFEDAANFAVTLNKHLTDLYEAFTGSQVFQETLSRIWGVPKEWVKYFIDSQFAYSTDLDESLTMMSEPLINIATKITPQGLMSWFRDLSAILTYLPEKERIYLKGRMADLFFDALGKGTQAKSYFDALKRLYQMYDVDYIDYLESYQASLRLFAKTKDYASLDWEHNIFTETSDDIINKPTSYVSEQIKQINEYLTSGRYNLFSFAELDLDYIKTQHSRNRYMIYKYKGPQDKLPDKAGEILNRFWSIVDISNKENASIEEQFYNKYFQILDHIRINGLNIKNSNDVFIFGDAQIEAPINKKVSEYLLSKGVEKKLVDELLSLSQQLGYKDIPRQIKPDLLNVANSVNLLRDRQIKIYEYTNRLMSVPGLIGAILPDDEEENSWYDWFRRGLLASSIGGLAPAIARQRFIKEIYMPAKEKFYGILSKKQNYSWDRIKLDVMASSEYQKLKTQEERDAFLQMKKNEYEIRDAIASHITLVNQSTLYKPDKNPIARVHNAWTEGDHVARRKLNETYDVYKEWRDLVSNKKERAILVATRADLYGAISEIWYNKSINKLEKFKKIEELKTKDAIVNRMLEVVNFESLKPEVKGAFTKQDAINLYERGWYALEKLTTKLNELEIEENFTSIFKVPYENLNKIKEQIDESIENVLNKLENLKLQFEEASLNYVIAKGSEENTKTLSKEIKKIIQEMDSITNNELVELNHKKQAISKLEKIRDLNLFLSYIPRWNYAKDNKPLSFSVYEVKYVEGRDPIIVPFYESLSKHRYYFESKDHKVRDNALMEWLKKHNAEEHIDEQGKKTGLYWVDATNYRNQKIDEDGVPIHISRKPAKRVLVKVQSNIDERLMLSHAKHKREAIITEVYEILRSKALNKALINDSQVNKLLTPLRNEIEEMRTHNEIAPDYYNSLVSILNKTEAIIKGQAEGKYLVDAVLQLLEKTYYPKLIDARPNRNYNGWQPKDIDGWNSILESAIKFKELAFASSMRRNTMIGQIDKELEYSARMGLFDRLYDQLIDYRKRLYDKNVDTDSIFNTGILKLKEKEIDFSKPINFLGSMYVGSALIYNTLSMAKNKLQMLVAATSVSLAMDLPLKNVLLATGKSLKTSMKFAYSKLRQSLLKNGEFRVDFGNEDLNVLWNKALREGEFYQNPFADIVSRERITDKLFILQRAAEFDNRSASYLIYAMYELSNMPKDLTGQAKQEYLKQIHLNASRFTELINGKYELINRTVWEQNLASHWLGRNLIRLYSPAFKQLYLWTNMLMRAIKPGPLAAGETNKRFAGAMAMVGAAFLLGGGITSIPLAKDLYDALGLIGNIDTFFSTEPDKDNKLFRKSLQEKFWLNAFSLAESFGIPRESMIKFKDVIEYGVLSTLTGRNLAWDEGIAGYFEPLIITQLAKGYKEFFSDRNILDKIINISGEYLPVTYKRLRLGILQLERGEYLDKNLYSLGKSFGLKDFITYITFGRPLFMAKASYSRLKEVNPIYSENQKREYIKKLLDINGIKYGITRTKYGKRVEHIKAEILNDTRILDYADDIKRELNQWEYDIKDYKVTSLKKLNEFLQDKDVQSLMNYISQKDYDAIIRWYKGNNTGFSGESFMPDDINKGMKLLDDKLKQAVSDYYNNAIAHIVLSKYINLARAEKQLKPLKIKYVYQDYPSIEGKRISDYSPEEQGYQFALLKLYSELSGLRGISTRRRYGKRIPVQLPEYE